MLIVCPNLAVDHTIRLSTLVPGAVTRTGPGGSVAGGKGANVARAALAIGGSPRVLGLLPEIGRDHLSALFAAESIPLGALAVAGVVRTCTAVIEDSGRTTLLNEPGPTIDADVWSALLELVEPTGQFVIGSGSLPPGSPTDGYARLVTKVLDAGGECAVDVGGDALRAAAQAGADLVCPNLFEASSILGGWSATEEVDERGDDVPERALAAARGLTALGARNAAVTAGAMGVALVRTGDDGREVAGEDWLPTVPVRASNPIGAGDSFLAGVAVAREGGESWLDGVRFGMAVAGSSVENDGAGVVDPARVAVLLTLLAAAHRQ